MIQINDNDLPITVAQKLIAGTREPNNKIEEVLNKTFGGEGKPDMFTEDELREIADYIYVYLKHNGEVQNDRGKTESNS